MGALIEVDDDGPVRSLTLNRPDRLNALNRAVLDELDRLLTEAAATDTAKCIVIRGAGDRAFCAGADLEEIRGLGPAQAHEFIRRGQRTMSAIESSVVPVIAEVDGFALGGGFELMLACHVAVASDRSSFGLPEARIGCIPGFGGTQRLFTAASRATAFHLLLTGDRVDAERAWHVGLLSLPPVAAANLPGSAREVAQRIAAGSRAGTRNVLEAGRRALRRPALEHEAALAAIAISSADGQEGITAFAERRSPVFDRERTS
ncbi:enoyl-CoA hydratase/isomerase family protein [Amycolatopsis sp. NPDC051371]|uniref:enoyl-CoA hydratase/isomerase family protein n=1 Tax=Amycolatopsis sp. NPDC051371 TaxID=3155800 RepID=UPI0034438859